MTTSPRTNAEAQAILDFVRRALDRAGSRHCRLDYAVQVELDVLIKETGLKQPFERILPTMAEVIAVVGGQMEVVEL